MYNKLKEYIENDLALCNAELAKVQQQYIDIIFWESNHGRPYPNVELAVDENLTNYAILKKMIEVRNADLVAVNSMMNN